jgi:hypothetical protein
MKLLTRVTALIVPLLFVLNANAGGTIEQDYVIKDVREVRAGSGIKLELTQGNVESLKLKTSTEILEYVHVDLTNNTLSLSVRKEFSDVFSWFIWDEVVFTLVVKDLTLIDLSGGVDAKVGDLNLSSLTIKASGGTDADFAKLQAKEINIEASGGSDLEVSSITSEMVRVNVSGGSDFEIKNSGTTNILMITASGGSDCDAKKLDSLTAEVVAGGGSDVDVKASETLKVSAGGASDVNYYGNPQVTSDLGGASDLTARK